jgi:TonB family protein
MKTPRPVFSLLLFVATALVASAALESARPLPDNPMPYYPPAMQMEGITRGRAVMAISIDAEGRVRDILPLAYTDPRFARVSEEVLHEWRFTPARFDGEPVPVQLELRLDFTLEGAVVTANITNRYLFEQFEHAGDNAFTYHPVGSTKADRAPVRISGGKPAYATEAAKEGITGRVTVRFYIDESGAVRLPAVETATNPYLMEQAMTAVRTWKFEPVTSRGQPVLVIAREEFNFVGGK